MWRGKIKMLLVKQMLGALTDACSTKQICQSQGIQDDMPANTNEMDGLI